MLLFLRSNRKASIRKLEKRAKRAKRRARESKRQQQEKARKGEQSRSAGPGFAQGKNNQGETTASEAVADKRCPSSLVYLSCFLLTIITANLLLLRFWSLRGGLLLSTVLYRYSRFILLAYFSLRCGVTDLNFPY